MPDNENQSSSATEEGPQVCKDDATVYGDDTQVAGDQARQQVQPADGSGTVTNVAISAAGMQFIARQEGFRANRYLDEAQNPTIGYGHLITSGETFPASGIDVNQALALMRQDIEERVMPGLGRVGVNLNQNQIDALGSFIFNVGSTAFQNSTLLAKLNGGDFDSVPDEMKKWKYAGGRISRILEQRRQAEADLFEK